MRIEPLRTYLDALPAVDAVAAQACCTVDARTKQPVPIRDERDKRRYRAEPEAPRAQYGQLRHDDQGKHEQTPREFIELEKMPEPDERRDGKTDGTDEAEHGESEDGARCEHAAQHDMPAVDSHAIPFASYRRERAPS